MDLLERVREDMARHRMTEPGSKVLVAVSGGADSVVLLHILYQLREELGISLHVAHLNHMLRGEEADGDARFVAGLARQYGLPATIRAMDVLQYRENKRISVETAAREVRYEFLEAVGRQCGASRIALAHQADDQAETILINFMRGSGITGLKGILPVRPEGYIRPLLSVRRCEIESYCLAAGLKFRTDSTNREDIYLRNHIRHHLIPCLEKEYNPGIVPALLRLGDLCREEDRYLQEQAGKAYAVVLIYKNEGGLALDLSGLAHMDPAMRRRIIRLAWADIAGQLAGGLALKHVDDVIRLIESGNTGARAVLPGGWQVLRSYRLLEFSREDDRDAIPDYFYPLIIPGDTYIPELKGTIYAEEYPADPFLEPKKLPPSEVVLDLAKLPPKLYVRRRREGDVFQPYGFSSEIKLKDFLIKQKIPRQKRDRIPLITTPEEIVWVAGLRVGEKWKISRSTKQILHLKFVLE
ncbi:MAG: tRNA lysidine(34) synthetase TilS [Pelotomaculum sp.]|jgi:tRNA(Ile)-lysidine synthase